MNKTLFLFLILLLVTLSSFSQSSSIFGVVNDQNGKPLELVNVALKGFPLGTSTNEKGEYLLNIEPNIKYVVSFTTLGYHEYYESVLLKNGQKKQINATLKESSEQIDEVDIEDKYVRKTSLIRLDPKIMSVIPEASGNFEAVIKTLPGVSSNNELSSQYNVRGGNFDENLVYVNGIQIYRPLLIRSGQQEGMSFINSEMVSSVLFSAGGFDAKYGDKLSSVLDIRYKKPTEFAASFSASLLGGSLTVQGDSKDHRFTHISGVRYKSTKYVLNSLETEGDYEPKFFDFQTYLSYDITDKLEIGFLGNVAQNSYKFIPQNRKTKFGTINEALELNMYFDGQEVDAFDTYMGAISFDLKASENLSLKLIGSAFSTNESETFDIQSQYWINEVDKDLGSETLGDSIANLGVGTYLRHARNYLYANVYALEHQGMYSNDHNFLQWGVKAQQEIIEDDLTEWKMVDSSGYTLPNSDEEIQMAYSIKAKNKIESFRYQAFAQNTYSIDFDSSELSFTGGIRCAYWDFNDEFTLSPRGNIAYKPNWENDFLFRFSAGFYYQPSFYKEMRDFDGNINANIKSQKSLHYVLGADYNFKAWNRPFKMVAELYYKQLKDIISYSVDNVRILYSGVNDADGYAAGLDMKVNGEFVKGVDSWFSLSVMKTEEDIRNDDHFETNDKGEQVWVEQGYIRRPADQRVNVGMFFQDYFPNRPDYKMHLQINYGSKLAFGAPQTPRWTHTGEMKSYQRVDIGFSKMLKRADKEYHKGQILYRVKDAWLSLEVFNLLDRNNTISHEWVTDYQGRQYGVENSMTGRRLNVKLSAKF
ncbi:MAG: TonB-dependent receptor [Salinivirgaceae bacterium]|nr:TonB-dependent receptor [Salinivirgaceae bacterium]